jgi:hypothetical protein
MYPPNIARDEDDQREIRVAKKAHDIFYFPREEKEDRRTSASYIPLPLSLGVVPQISCTFQPSQNSWRGAVIGLI